MKNLDSNSIDLIAPCGMNCAICSKYLSHINNLKRSQCRGCRTENNNCTYLFAKCTGLNNSLKRNATASFCFECHQYPCKQINRMDIRYRNCYAMSIIDDLENIKKLGNKRFPEEQKKEISL